MEIKGKTAVVTGAGSGIGRATALELAQRGVRGLAVVDRSDSAARELATHINHTSGREVARAFVGDTCDAAFRRSVYDDVQAQFGHVAICVPAAGITRDALAVKVDKSSGRAQLYPEETFRQVNEINLMAPIYWVLEMIGQIAEDRHRRGVSRWNPKDEKLQGTAVFIGSVSSQGNKGQVAYAATKRGLEGAAATLMKEGMYYGVKCALIHPGFTDTPMVRALGADFIENNILPYTQLRRLIRPEEIASAICFLIQNSAVSGELWVDAGWHPSA